MPFIGNKPSAVPLTSADIADGIITSAKIVDGTIVNADINASSAIAISKISATGTSEQVLRMNTGATALEFATVSGTTFGSALLHVRDEKASGTDAGSATTGSYQKRTLNTVMTNEISGASLSSSVITLPSGTYYAFGSSPIYNGNQHRIKLRNTSDSSDALLGTTEYNNNGAYVVTRSFIAGRFTIASSKNFELQYRVANDSTGNALGTSSGHSIVEVYADVQIWKIA
jgi:hypothetical protein